MKSYRETGPSTSQTPATSNIQTIKIENAPVQDMNNQPQTVQVQYVDQDGNVLHVVNQPGNGANCSHFYTSVFSICHYKRQQRRLLKQSVKHQRRQL
jgi:hypothetical protein